MQEQRQANRDHGKGSQIAKRAGYMATAFGATDFITSGARQKMRTFSFRKKKVKKV